MKFIIIVLLLPVIGIFLYTALYPRESTLIGKRWQFRNQDLEPSDEAIKYNRKASIIALIIIIVIIVIVLFREDKAANDIIFSLLID